MDDIQAEQKKYGSGGGDYFKFEKEGLYKIRILNQPKVVATHFFGKGNPAVVCVGIEEGCVYHGEGAPLDDNGKPKTPSIKLATYVIDRNDDKVKMAELPLSISYSLNDLQEDEDYAFSEFPMPYDVKITYDPDNKDPKAKYRLMGSPNRVELTVDEEKALAEAMKKQTPEQYVEAKKGKKATTNEDTRTAPEYPEEEITPSDIPF